MKNTECVAFLQWALPQLVMRWPGFRKVRRQVCRRIGRRLCELGLPDVAAYRACLERNQAVIYRGPFKEVLDDDGHRLRRGERIAVCDKTFRIYQSEPYASHFELVEPLEPIALADAEPFDCARTAPRHPRESKGLDYDITTDPAGDVCGPDGCC